jgi:hypothetical protein
MIGRRHAPSCCALRGRLKAPIRRLTVTTLVLALALAVAGCARHVPIARPYPSPSAAELVEILAARHKVVGSMNARVRATSWLGGDRVRATVLMLVDRPGRLRFEAEVSLQGTVAVLATDGHQFAFLDAMRNELRRGPACPANVASLIRIPLGPADVAAVLLGDVRLPQTVRATDGVVDWDGEQGADVLVVRGDDGGLRLSFRRPSGDNRNVEILGATATRLDGRTRWRVAFEDFVRVAPVPGQGVEANVALPQTIRFAESDGPFDEGVEIKFKERTLNQSAPKDAFLLAMTPGTTTIDVGCPPSAPSAPCKNDSCR